MSKSAIIAFRVHPLEKEKFHKKHPSESQRANILRALLQMYLNDKVKPSLQYVIDALKS